jgi:hypothetical protein
MPIVREGNFCKLFPNVGDIFSRRIPIFPSQNPRDQFLKHGDADRVENLVKAESNPFALRVGSSRQTWTRKH